MKQSPVFLHWWQPGQHKRCVSFSQERESEVLAIPDGRIHQAIDDQRLAD